MRIIYIPGLGEKCNVFDNIIPHIAASENLFLDNWELLGDVYKKEINVLEYASLLVAKYSICRDDIIIGHSMGGWIAYHIKHLVNCRIVQIASFTDTKKISGPTTNFSVIYFMAKSGLYFNRIIEYYIFQKFYKGKPSAPLFIETFERLRKGNKNNVLNQLNILFKPVKTLVKVIPDMRIHGNDDTLVRIPSAPFINVPGDHFCLYTNPQEVYQAILKLLSQETVKK